MAVTDSPDAILSAIRRARQGLSLAELLAALPDFARRTAQRRLAQLVDEGDLRATGLGRARRYMANTSAKSLPDGGLPSFPADIPLSADSRDILAYVTRPLTARKPVGYQREFLDAYRPNVSRYLPRTLCDQLRRLGAGANAEAPAGTYSRAILNRLLIDLSWASSQLEGNTYSRLDTRRLIEQGKAARGKAALETQMILNHKAAIELLVENAASVGFDRFTLMNLHAALAENLLPSPADEGRVRQHVVNIGSSVYRPLGTPQRLEEMLDAMLGKAGRISEPFEQSFFVMVHLPYLQPFADINKRTSRLAANIPLFRANLCPLTFLDVPRRAYECAMLGVYEMARVELLRDLYVWAYERSAQEYLAIRQDLAEPDPVRLGYRDLIKATVGDVVRFPDRDSFALIRSHVTEQVRAADRDKVQAVIIEELRRLHEGVLARYGLRPSEYQAWRERQSS